jgi:hypothetical protein
MKTNGIALATSKMVLPQFAIDEILKLYLPEYRFVETASFNGFSMDATLKTTLYPYTKTQLFDYITAPTANLIGCQLTYVLTGGLLFLGTKHPSAPDFDWDAFLRLRDKALLKFSSFKLDFRREVKNSDSLKCKAELLHIKRIMNHTHTDIRFEIEQGIQGSIHGVILDE